MAFAAAMDQHGDTKELLARYDKVAPVVQGLGPPPGLIAHYCFETDYGIRVVNIYETEEQLRASYDRAAFREALKEGGIEYEDPTIMRVHNYRHF
jgi:heme-degrading monooxygenase HmoA